MTIRSTAWASALILLAAMSAILATPARTDEAKVRRTLAKAMPGAQIESIVAAPIKGAGTRRVASAMLAETQDI